MAEESVLDALFNTIEQELDDKNRLRTDLTTRILYSTDASIYSIEPYGVVFPQNTDEIAMIIETCALYKVPVLARGAGTSLAGQAIGKALIIDYSKHINRILEINKEEKTAVIEPGVVMNDLNFASSKYGLHFGPDPASSERATMGGSLANNASGAHSIVYGMAADHLLSVDAILSDGSMVKFFETEENTAEQLSLKNTIEGDIYRAALNIRNTYKESIINNWPKVWRRASGYNLNYLIPWSPSIPPGWEGSQYPPVKEKHINIAQLLAGSEGTLAVIAKAKVRLEEVPLKKVMAIFNFDSVIEACDAVPEILITKPLSIELIPQSIINLARSIPAYSHQLDIVTGNPKAILVVEFTYHSYILQQDKIHKMLANPLIIEDPNIQKKVWEVRKVGLGIIQSIPGDVKPVAFIEDLSVPVQDLGNFVRELDIILQKYGTTAEFYAHASAGCLHIRPYLNMKNLEDIHKMHDLAQDAIELTLNFKGAISGEHGDGISRSIWLRRMYGDEILQAFRELKQAADPDEIMNPGKIVSLDQNNPIQGMDTNLRYGPGYKARIWGTVLDFSGEGGIGGAIELCNGAGVCRKSDGVMCPSFQASAEEKQSTRGRANLLRAMISGQFPSEIIASMQVYEALDLCLACKGCKAECPSSVDMAKIKYEFLNYYYKTNPRRVRDYLFGYIGIFLKLGQLFSPLTNFILSQPIVKLFTEKYLGLSRERQIPRLASRNFQKMVPNQMRSQIPISSEDRDPVILLIDAFNEYFYPQSAVAALNVLSYLGCSIKICPISGAGRTLISKGMLEPAQKHSHQLIEWIKRVDPLGRAQIVGIEPSEIYTLRDEYKDLIDDKEFIESLINRSWMIDEFLLRPDSEGIKRIFRIANKHQHINPSILLHGHCYQKSLPPANDTLPVGVNATKEVLEVVGYKVQVMDSSCCGMAGSFGYENEHYEFSKQIGEMKLLPSIRKADDNYLVATSGVSCKSQIEDLASRHTYHPIQLVEMRINIKKD